MVGITRIYMVSRSGVKYLFVLISFMHIMSFIHVLIIIWVSLQVNFSVL